MIAVGELLDPRLAGAVGFEVQHAGQRLAVVGPAAAVFDEEFRLRGGAAVAVREVVAAAQEACFARAGVVGGEFGVFVRGAFGGFDVDEAKAAGVVGGVEVDVGLVMGDVEALDFGAFAELCWDSSC